MENTIAFRYNPVNYKFSFLDVIVNVRAHYKNEDIFVYLDDNRDDLKFYKIIGKKYNLKIILRETHRTFINKNDSFDINLPKIKESIQRIYHTCTNTEAKWIINLEDDVHVKKRIDHFPTTDVGTNRPSVGFAGGGGIFLRTKFVEVYEEISDTQLIDMFKKNKNNIWATDIIMKRMYETSEFTSEKWVELAEPGYFENNPHSVFHGNKELHKLG